MKKKILYLFSMLLIAFLTIPNVYALETTEFGETVVQEGKYNSTRFVAGNKVTNKADVDGLSFVAGNEVDLEGSAPYGFYAGNIVTINERVGRDIFVAGNTVKVNKGAFIGRDAYIFGNSVTISANISRDLKIAGTSIDLSGIIVGGDAYINAENVILDEKTVIIGKLTYSDETNITGLDVASIGSIEVTKIDKVVVEETIVDKISSFIVSAIAAFITMIVLFYFIPKTKEKLNNIELKVSSIAKTSGIGFLTLIAVPIIVVIALFTRILMPLSLITLAIYVIGIYLSSLLVYYIVGNIITTKIIKKDNMYLALACGIIVVKVIKVIPVIGGLVSAIALFYGMGLIFKFIKSRGN